MSAPDGSGNTEPLTLPGGSPGQIELLEKVGNTVLYAFSTLDDTPGEGLPVYDQTLFALDLNGTHISVPINGIDGNPLAVDKIIPIPGTSTALVHARSGDLYTLDIATPGVAPPWWRATQNSSHSPQMGYTRLSRMRSAP
ncbi:MAG: hypothetical protein ABI566_01355 [Pseudolysinimonas sp.]